MSVTMASSQQARARLFQAAFVVLPAAVCFHDLVGSPTAVVRADGEMNVVWVDRMSVKVMRRSLALGESVAFTSPYDPSQICVKRVLAGSGEMIQHPAGSPLTYLVPSGCFWAEDGHYPEGVNSFAYGPVRKEEAARLLAFTAY
jgi:hypothetical protein